jgi:hypothetical protein
VKSPGGHKDEEVIIALPLRDSTVSRESCQLIKKCDENTNMIMCVKRHSYGFRYSINKCELLLTLLLLLILSANRSAFSVLQGHQRKFVPEVLVWMQVKPPYGI